MTSAKAQGLDTELEANESAPFPGVLVPESNYREYTVYKREWLDLSQNKEDYIKCGNSLPEISLFSARGYGVVVTVGIVALLTGMILDHNL